MAVAKKSKKEVEDKEITIRKAKAQSTDTESGADKSVESTLIALYKLQLIFSRIDKVRVIRGELPLEVSDLEDECLGLDTRINKFKEFTNDYQRQTGEKQEIIKKAKTQIAKYKEQLDNVRNNREYDALSKEIEYEELDIQLNEKKIREIAAKIEDKNTEIEELTKELEITKASLDTKKQELNSIISETEKEEQELLKQAEQQETKIEPRMLNAFSRIRTSIDRKSVV